MLVATAVAVVELIALVGVGALVLARPLRHHPAAKSTAHAAAAPRSTLAVRATRAPVRKPAPIPSHPLRARGRVPVLVLNGNGVQGAAHAAAARLQSLGYPIGGTANAPRHDYSRSMVMFVPGYAKEARRLARDTGIRLVAPVDGLTPAALRASRLIVLLGS
jgi:hypothetical protein